MNRKIGRKKTKKEVKRRVELLEKIGLVLPKALLQSGDDLAIEEYLLVASSVAEPFRTGVNGVNVRHSAHQALRSLDLLLAKRSMLLESEERPSQVLACQQGCNHCCYLRVTERAPVILALAYYLKKKLESDALEALMTRVNDYCNLRQKLTPLQVVRTRMLCPLNVDGLCIGYEYRPFSCRSHHSFDRKTCEKAVLQPEIDTMIPQDPVRIHAQSICAHPAADVMAKFGLQQEELEFIPALRIAMERDSVLEEYLEGRDPMAPAYQPAVLAEQLEEGKRLSGSSTS